MADDEPTCEVPRELLEDLRDGAIGHAADWHSCSICGAFVPTSVDHHAPDCAYVAATRILDGKES